MEDIKKKNCSDSDFEKHNGSEEDQTRVDQFYGKLSRRGAAIIIGLVDLILTGMMMLFCGYILCHFVVNLPAFSAIHWTVLFILIALSIPPPIAAMVLLRATHPARSISKAIMDINIWGICSLLYVALTSISLTMSIFYPVLVDPFHAGKIYILLRIAFLIIVSTYLKQLSDINFSLRIDNVQRHRYDTGATVLVATPKNPPSRVHETEHNLVRKKSEEKEND